MGRILVGLVAAGLLAVVLGIPTLRLRADYLAIVTIAASEILRLIFRSTASDSITGSTNGLFASPIRSPRSARSTPVSSTTSSG